MSSEVHICQNFRSKLRCSSYNFGICTYTRTAFKPDFKHFCLIPDNNYSNNYKNRRKLMHANLTQKDLAGRSDPTTFWYEFDSGNHSATVFHLQFK